MRKEETTITLFIDPRSRQLPIDDYISRFYNYNVGHNSLTSLELGEQILKH